MINRARRDLVRHGEPAKVAVLRARGGVICVHRRGVRQGACARHRARTRHVGRMRQGELVREGSSWMVAKIINEDRRERSASTYFCLDQLTLESARPSSVCVQDEYPLQSQDRVQAAQVVQTQ